MISLRKAVMVHITFFLLALCIAVAATAYALVRSEVNGFQDNTLQEIALTAGSIFRHDIEPRIEAELEDQLVIQMWDRAGAPVHRSGPPAEIPQQHGLGYADVRASGFDWRVYTSRDGAHVIQVSQRWSAREEVAMYAAGGAVLPILVAMPLGWLSISWSVRRILSKLTEATSSISRRTVDAKERIDASKLPAEIVPLVQSMNALIDRHQQALDTQRRFVADAAHELRTPLAALQIQVDNLIARPLEQQTMEIAGEALGGVRRVSYLVNQLLAMARADAAVRSRLERIQLALFVRRVADDVAPLANAKGVGISIDVPSDIQIETQLADLALILTNILDNAVRYSEPRGDVRIAAAKVGQRVTLEVLDQGIGIPEELLPLVFDRFFRADPDASGGSGLGLAIAKATAERAGIGLSIQNRPDRRGVSATVEIHEPQTA